MNDYVEVRIDLEPCSEPMTDVMAAVLADRGFESFVPDDNGLTAYIPKRLYSDSTLDGIDSSIPFDTSISCNVSEVEGRDWNAEWEKNYFKPIVIDDICVIHSSFHRDIPKVPYDIVIDPKMAFGTGHHQTTTLIIRQLLRMNLNGKSLIDVGTGTGILAILASMRGAAPVTGIEIDGWAYENAVENVALNSHPEIRVIHGDASALENMAPADIVLANINRNIIVGDIDRYAKALKPWGMMILSGFYKADALDIMDAGHKAGLEYHSYETLDDWTTVILIKKSDAD